MAATSPGLGRRIHDSSALGLFLGCVGHGGWLAVGVLGFWWWFEGRVLGC